MLVRALAVHGTVVLTALFLAGEQAQAQERLSTDEVQTSRFWQAAGGVAAINALTWFYNWHIQRWDWADIGTRSWWANLRGGFAWDDDAFGANQAAHPYHGSLYHNSARASGYNFWSSAPFVAAGSLSWELFTENVRPSLNDLINTTLGGIALGEVSFRMSALLRSSKGAPAGRQMGAFVLSPIARAQSLLNSTQPPAAMQARSSSSASLAVGQRRGEGGSAFGESPYRPYVGLTVEYGSPFDAQFSRPYDAFEFRVQLSPDENVVLTHASVSGLLARHRLARSPRTQLLLGLFQHYEYNDLPIAKSSSQGVSGALLYRRTAGPRTQLELGIHTELTPLAAVASEHNGFRRRDYDLGPGFGGRFIGALRHDGRELIRLEGRTVWIHSLYAADADHLLTTARVSAAVPVLRMVSVGGDVGLTIRQSFYRDQPRVTRKVPQFRAYLVWSPS